MTERERFEEWLPKHLNALFLEHKMLYGIDAKFTKPTTEELIKAWQARARLDAISIINELSNQCKGSVYISLNPHLNDYQSIPDYLADSNAEMEDIDRVRHLNNFVEIQFYPDTPIGFYRVVDKDIEGALFQAKEILDKDNEGEAG